MKKLLILAFLIPSQVFGAVSQLNVMARAKGNGIDDDTVAVQKMINTASTFGISLYFPDGIYKVSNLLVTNSLTFVMDKNAKLIQDNSVDGPLLRICGTNQETFAFLGGVFDGNKQARTNYWTSYVDNGSLIDSTNGNKALYFQGVVFTNAVRSTVRTAGYADFNSCKFVAMKEHEGTNLQSLAYTIYAQPVGYADDMTLRVVNCDFIGSDFEDVNLWKQAAGIYLTEEAGGTNKFREVIVLGNRAKGIGGNRLLQPVSFLDTYNGTHRLVAMGNHITYSAFAAFKITRCDDAIVSHNTIEHITNPSDFNNVCFGILWEPYDREGTSPFTGARLGERHYNFICEGNTLRGMTRSPIYIHGPNALVRANILDTVAESDLGDNLPITLWDADNSDVIGNMLNNVPENGIWIVGGTNITVANNRFTPITQATTNTLVAMYQTKTGIIADNFLLATTNSASPSAAGVWLSGTENITVKDNVAINCTIGYDNHSTTNSIFRNNREFNCTSPIAYDTTTVGLIRENNSWQTWQWRNDTNGIVYINIANLDTNENVQAMLELSTDSAGGYVSTYPTNFVGTMIAGRTVIGANTDGTGVDTLLHSGQTFRIHNNSLVILESTPDTTKVTGNWTTPLIINSTNGIGTYILFQNQNTNLAHVGWNPAYPGLTIADSSGGDINLRVDDTTGDTVIRGGLTIGGPLYGVTSMDIDELNINTLGVTNSITASNIVLSATAEVAGTGSFNAVTVTNALTTKGVASLNHYVEWRATTTTLAGYQGYGAGIFTGGNNDDLGIRAANRLLLSSANSATPQAMLNGNDLTVAGTVNATNGFYVATQAGITATVNVLVAGGTTNRMVWTSGILVSNITNYAE